MIDANLQADAHARQGVALQRAGQIDEAIPHLTAALALQPQHWPAMIGLSWIRTRRGDAIEGERLARSAIQLAPHIAAAHIHLGFALMCQHRAAEAIEPFTQAVALDPASSEARWALASMHMLAGDFSRAWENFDHRLATQGDVANMPKLKTPRWNGEEIAGKTLLVQAEQGYGDTMQFSRYVPMLTQRAKGANVIFRCQPPLVPLVRTLPGNPTVVPGDQPAGCHLHIPLLSLPRIFGTTLQTIPASIPYLRADAALAAEYAKQLDASKLRVGLSWVGSTLNVFDDERSIDPRFFAPLAELRGIQWISLQKDRADPKPPLPMLDLVGDFTQTAALMMNLDLIIGIDSAMIHLAAALGRPTWTLLKHTPDWRWMLDRKDTPWYRTMRLFRQPRYGDWAAVIAQVADELPNVGS